jgi:hypothetical protein
MRSVFTLSLALVCLGFFSACGSAPDSAEGSTADVEPAAEGAMSTAEMAQELSCWLRGATMEEAMERASPLGETEIALEGHVGKICYGRPSAKGRAVEGGLIPFGQPWRLGANEATAIHFPFPVEVGGIPLEAGSYSLFAIADEFEWQFVLNSNAERWGIPLNDEVRATDVGTFTGLPRALTEPVEQFTINWHTHGGDNGHLVLEWGSTRVEIEVKLLANAQ